MKEVNFLNLTNGLDFIEKVDNPQFMRIRSTTLERSDYRFLLMDLDHNFLMNLAIGNRCNVFDCGTNRAFSKTIYLGIPFIRYALSRRWFGKADTPYRLSRCGKKQFKIEERFSEIYDHLFFHNQDKEKAKLKAKIDYYRKFLKNNCINLEGYSVSTDMDGKYNYWKSKVLEYEKV